jgi:hypothetical protein
MDLRGIGVDFVRDNKFVTSPQHPDRLGVHPASYPKGATSPGVKQLGSETDRSRLSSAEV